jgi:hypothetical protein
MEPAPRPSSEGSPYARALLLVDLGGSDVRESWILRRSGSSGTIRLMTLWGMYFDHHSEVDLAGDSDGLRQLADMIVNGQPNDLLLAHAPPDSSAGTRALHALRLAPTSDTTDRIRFSRDGAVLVIAGPQNELGRILAGPVRDLAEGEPSRETRVRRHVHFDPTSDRVQRTFAPESISIVVSLAPDN